MPTDRLEAQSEAWVEAGLISSAQRESILERARAAGCQALVLTVDTKVQGPRERDMRNGFSLPLRFDARSILSMMRHPAWCLDKLAHGTPKLQNIAPYLPPGTSAGPIASFIASQIDATFDWDDIARLRDRWKGKLVVKGVLAPADRAISRARAAGHQRLRPVSRRERRNRRFDRRGSHRGADQRRREHALRVVELVGRRPVLDPGHQIGRAHV